MRALIIKALKQPNGEITHDPIKIANLLNKCFKDFFVIEDDGPLPSFQSKSSGKQLDFNPGDSDVPERLKNLAENKACGADKLHPALLRNCAEAYALLLTLIFRESLKNSIQISKCHTDFQKIRQDGCKKLSPSFIDISSMQNSRMNLDIVLLDFAKAFDTVLH